MSLDAHNKALASWMDDLDKRRIVLPRFQRYEAWSNREIADLLQTVLRGLPAGSLLTQRVEGEPLFRWRALQSAPENGEHIASLLLDGQQRLTALWRVLSDNYETRTFFVQAPGADFSPAQYQQLEVRAEPISLRKGVRYPQWAEQPAECWARHFMPARLLHPARTGADINAWALEAAQNDALAAMTIAGCVNDLKARAMNFNLPYLELPATTPREVVLDVFVKLNTRNVRLSAFDIIVAEVEALDESLHSLVEGLCHRVPRLLDYDDAPQDLLLQVACLLQNRVPNQSGFFGLDLAEMVANWDDIERGVRAGVQFLEDEHLFDGQRLPTEAVLAPLFALWAKAPVQPDALGNFRALMKRYLWRACFSDRYESAAANAQLQDYRALRDLNQAPAGTVAVPIFDDVIAPLPNAEALKLAGWPRGRQRLARAILALSLRGNALDVADAAPLSREHLAQREYHHLFPVAFLKGQGRGENEAMRALNCALISWRTNRTISDSAPSAYLAARLRKSASDAVPAQAEIRHRLQTHGINYDSLETGNYDDFLDQRSQWAQQAMNDLCQGKDWKP